MIIGIRGHLSHIHFQMVFRAGSPFVFLEVWELELVGYMDIRYQAQVMNIPLKYLFPAELHFTVHLVILLP